MKIVGIIPARYASTRFPGKPLVDLKGKPMIQRVYEGAQRSKFLDRVIVATDDQRIFDAVQSFGGDVVMTSETHPSGTDRCGEVAANLEAEVIVNIQGDEPLVDVSHIDALCKVFEDPSVEIATLGHQDVSDEDRTNPNKVKVVCDAKGNALYFSRSEIPDTSRASEAQLKNYPFLRHIGLYAYRKDTLKQLVALDPCPLEMMESLEQLRWLYHGFPIRVVETRIETPNIDTPEDLEKVLSLL